MITKDDIVETLKKHLRRTDSTAISALLELTTAFARDLQFEFYPYFQDFFEIIVQLLRKRDADQIEACFTALATMFKILWR
jgi:U3 small nucleolar RNA-associated protein 20